MARNNLSNSYTEAILFAISPHCNMEICKIANTHTTLSTYLCRSHIKALQSRYLHGKGKNCRLQRCRPSARHHMHQSDCDSRDLYQCSLHVNSKKGPQKGYCRHAGLCFWLQFIDQQLWGCWCFVAVHVCRFRLGDRL
jgi:hypothetical protein